MRKSGDEFTGHSICSFLTILPCIAIIYLAVFFLDSGPASKSSPASLNNDISAQPRAETGLGLSQNNP